MTNTINIVRLSDIMPDIQRSRTLTSAWTEIHKQGIALQAIKSVMQSMQETIHRLEASQGNHHASQSCLQPHEAIMFEEYVK